jgi:hypothetical protein
MHGLDRLGDQRLLAFVMSHREGPIGSKFFVTAEKFCGRQTRVAGTSALAVLTSSSLVESKKRRAKARFLHTEILRPQRVARSCLPNFLDLRVAARVASSATRTKMIGMASSAALSTAAFAARAAMSRAVDSKVTDVQDRQISGQRSVCRNRRAFDEASRSAAAAV